MTSRGPAESGSWKLRGGDFGAAHVHFEFELECAALQEAQSFDAGAGADADDSGGVAVANEEGGGAARAVARHLGDAAVGVVELDGAFGIGVAGGIDEHPAIGADAGVAVADGAREGGVVTGGGVRRVMTPGEEKIVFGAVGFGERDLHSWMRSTSTAVP